MSFNVKFGKFSKKKNSTAQPSDSVFTLSTDLHLKDGCSDRNPVFLLNYDPGAFDFNYAKWGTWYYYIDNVIYERNNLISVYCSLDVLATYKSRILQTSAFVAYSSVSGGQWLADDRIPVTNDVTVATEQVLPTFWSEGGHYILATIGETGSVLYSVSLGQLQYMIRAISTTNATLKSAYDALQAQATTVEEVLNNVGGALLQSGLMGNGYENAPSCIRSCHWVPFNVPTIDNARIFLGSYDTGVDAGVVNISPIVGGYSINIPWQFDDWRRAKLEDIYLYLPFVGMVHLASENLTHTDIIVVNVSYTVTDGQISYLVSAGNEIIGTYGGSCLMQYPVGINQHASIGAIANSFIEGFQKSVTGSFGIAGLIASSVTGAVSGAWDAGNTALSTNPSCIGGIGGGAGSGLNKHIVCFSVAHGTSCSPDEMKSVLGVPTMKPISLSSCTGFVKCTDAHCSIPASGDIINAVDMFLNSGFYIE